MAAGAVGTVDTQAFTMTLASAITSADATSTFAKSGSGTLILTGAKAYTGGTTINAGTLQLGNGATIGSLAGGAVIDNGTLAFNNTAGAQTFANTISGNGSLSQIGNNVLTLSGNNTFSGGMTINGGTVTLNGTGQTAAGTGTITILNNGTLNLNPAAAGAGSMANGVFIGAGQTGNIVNTNIANEGWSGPLTGSGTLNISPFAGSTRSKIFGDWSGFTGTANIGVGESRFNIGTFDGSHAAFTLAPATTLYSAVANATINLGSLTGTGTFGGPATTSANATWQIGNLVGAGTTDIFLGTASNGAAGAQTSITMMGAGTLDLAGNNSFTGAIGVNQEP